MNRFGELLLGTSILGAAGAYVYTERPIPRVERDLTGKMCIHNDGKSLLHISAVDITEHIDGLPHPPRAILPRKSEEWRDPQGYLAKIHSATICYSFYGMHCKKCRIN